MSKEKRRVPKLRFPGFTEDWEQRKLVDIFEYLQNNTLSRDSLNYKVPNIKNIHYGDILVKFDEILNGDNSDIPFINSDIDLSKYSKSLLADGDIIFSDTAEDDSVGKAIELQNVNEPFILSGLHTIPCRTLIPFGKGYLGSFLNSDAYRIQLKPLVQGIKVSSISKSALKDTTIKYPNKLEEQEKIGTLFSEITALITLHQRKLNNIKLKKKALLQKLFPKNGERYPELRFPGFTDAWEQRKLDTSTTFIGDGLHGTPKYDENGTHYFINGNNLVDSKISITEETKRVSDEALSNDDRRLNSTAILMSINGTIGVLARYNNENIMLGKSVAYITPKNINRDFLFYQLQGNVIQTYFYKNLTGTTIKNLGLGTIKNTIVMSTLPEEESEIGQFFYKLDQYITLHQRKLDHLQLQKKALLQQMFV